MLSRFHVLDQLLTDYQLLWRFEPFHHSRQAEPAWQTQYPQLSEWLGQLSPADVEYYKSSPQALQAKVTQCLPELHVLTEAVALEPADVSTLSLDRGIDSGIPGRKLTQILAMGQAALKAHSGSEWLEWCAGKGFLGRILASQSRQNVTSFEFQTCLCESGQRDADKRALPMQFVQGDAFGVESDDVFNARQHAVALHACGDLHVALMHKSVRFGLPAITLSPCCYHLIEGESYRPLSSLGQNSSLALTRQELRIPLQETVTGGERVRRHRFQEMVYRLGFDLLLRSELSLQQYLPIPSIRKSMLADGFEVFCRWAAEQKQMILPDCDWAYYHEQAERRFWHMERLSLIQDIFRRPLEMWLVMDKASYLSEQGYRVNISEFCRRDITPRNILIHAERGFGQ
ncbi:MULTISPECIES: methyltransferase [unclassified Vibrio]|uniref:methyltransferase n=1 Tax=unclassified Vibrio TaxID=2614977 RepID=UPI001360EC9D|nr:MULTISPECIES: methyltransferase [unclassified Vibrio]NAW57325.1 methyltransferase [Vibrio sp. V36_P2S2PM302]NAX23924.1 methyltransferase [Vibrio sp. V38_P2S17PM301]NAX29491.1 methyltransferase [Vibrio sp. V37_P2S8PM304]